MSLLQRMERAQKAKEAAEAAANGTAAPETPEAVAEAPTTTFPTDPVAVAVAPVPVSTNGNGTRRLPVPVGPANVGPAVPSGLMRAAPAPGREDLIREVRFRLQGEMVGAFKTLLDTSPEIRAAVMTAVAARIRRLEPDAVS